MYKPGEYLVHIWTKTPCIVDTEQIYNSNKDTTTIVRYDDDLPTLTVQNTNLVPACMACYGVGKKDLGGFKIECDSCNGTGILK